MKIKHQNNIGIDTTLRRGSGPTLHAAWPLRRYVCNTCVLCSAIYSDCPAGVTGSSFISNQPTERTVLSMSVSPKVSAGARPVLEMVEPVGVPENNIPLEQPRDELCELVAVPAHPKVLGDPNGRPAAGGSNEAERDGEPLAVAAQQLRLLAVPQVAQGIPGVGPVPEPSLQLPRDLGKLGVDHRRRRVGLVPRNEGMHHVPHLDPAARRALLQALRRHPPPRLIDLGPPPRGGEDIGCQHVVPGVLGFELEQPLGGDPAHSAVGVHSASSQEGAPNWRGRGGGHSRYELVRLVHPAGAAQHVHRAGVVFGPRLKLVAVLHQLQVTHTFIGEPGVAASVQERQEADVVRQSARLLHLLEQSHGLRAPPVHAVGVDDGGPEDQVLALYPVEQLAAGLDITATRVHVHQRIN